MKACLTLPRSSNQSKGEIEWKHVVFVLGQHRGSFGWPTGHPGVRCARAIGGDAALVPLVVMLRSCHWW